MSVLGERGLVVVRVVLNVCIGDERIVLVVTKWTEMRWRRL